MNNLKSSESQLRAAKNYRNKKRAEINLHMKEYYTINKEEIGRKRKEIRDKKKAEKLIAQPPEPPDETP